MTFADGGTGEVHIRQLRLTLPSSGRSQTLPFGSSVLGCAEDADVKVDDGSVSRRHLSLEPTRGGVMIRDLDSKNGTRVAGVRIKQALVPAGRSFTAGQVEVQVSWEQAVSVEAPSDAQFFISDSAPLRRAFDVLSQAASSAVPIALQGAEGVGRATIARRIHELSGRDDFCTWQADSDARIPSGFVGTVHVRGIAAAVDAQQLQLLAALETREARWVTELPDNIDELLGEGLRSDLFYAAAVVRVRVPTLAERLCDVPRLAADLLRRHGGPGRRLSPAAVTALSSYSWPGNLPELESVIRRAVALDSSPVLAPAALFGETAEALDFRTAKEQVVQAFEKQFVESLLARHEGSISRAAEEAGLSRNALYALMRRVGLKQ